VREVVMMKDSKRIEIVIEQPMAERMIEVLRKLDAPGYTLLRNVGGYGDRGTRRADELAGDSSNCLFLIACDDPEVVQRITEGVRPLLTRFGGICLVSDCQWLPH
jgi:nitrogen regulatory protein P-II 1